MKTTTPTTVNVDNFRRLVQTYINLHVYNSALYWADKVVALTGNPRDIYWLAQCMYLLKQYHRAAHLLRSKNLEKTYLMCNYLTVKCLLEANELNEALKVANVIDIEMFIPPSNNYTPCKTGVGDMDPMLFDDTPKNQVFSSVMFLRGKVLESMDNRGLASDCYKQALFCDVYCFEAFDSLIKHQMLTAAEEQDLMSAIPISEQCGPEEAEILRTLYESKLKKYHTPSSVKEDHAVPRNTPVLPNRRHFSATPLTLNLLPSTPSLQETPPMTTTPNLARNNDRNVLKSDLKRLKTSGEQTSVQIKDSTLSLKLWDSLDMHVAQAERLYYNCDFQQCSNLTESILKQDPYHDGCLPIHIACQVELQQSNKIFSLAHNLVDLYPNMAISWFAVGCYYYIINKSDYARRYLAKATSLDRLFGPAWLAYGHSFAIENEHDQAMAAYFKASQLMKGCHLPLLYIGLECGLTNNVRLAEKFFQQAQAIAPDDPFILHEKGVIAFQNLEYKSAEKNFKDALKLIKKINKNGLIPQQWGSLLNNLGHTCRKLKKYEEAMEYHEQALLLSPLNASTYSAIGYVQALMGRTDEAVDRFHKALGLKRNDTFSSTMLNYLIEQLSDEHPSYPGAPTEIPKYNLDLKVANTTTDSSIAEESLVANSGIEPSDMSMSIEVEMSDASGIIKD